MKKSAVYLRVSTDEQSVRSQKLHVMDFCKKRGWKNLSIYEEKESGAKITRPVLDKLIQTVREGKIDRVIAYKLDRIGRSLVHLALIIEELGRLNVPMVFTSQGIDTSDQNPAGKLQLGVLMAVAEFERANIRERTRAGQAAARKRGRVFGRPPTAAKHRGKVREMRRAGKSIRAIARELGISATSVSRLCVQTNDGKDKESKAKTNQLTDGNNKAREKSNDKTARIRLFLRVQGNSKFVRGEKRAIRSVQRFLPQYGAVVELDDSECILDVPHRTDDELDKKMNELLGEIGSAADLFDCFSESHAEEEGTDRNW